MTGLDVGFFTSDQSKPAGYWAVRKARRFDCVASTLPSKTSCVKIIVKKLPLRARNGTTVCFRSQDDCGPNVQT
jgi:hypothetical protein